MVRDLVPTVRTRELSAGLRRALARCKLTGKQAARLLGWTPSKVSRLLNGRRRGVEVDVAALLAVCRVTGAERDRLLALCREQHNPGWWQQHGSHLPKQLVTLIDHENKAVTISEFQEPGVPGLLQTGEYAHALISRCGNVPPDEVADRVAARVARQSLFTRALPPQFNFYLHEFVLRLPVGGPAVMFNQLRHLLRMMTRPNLTLRVVPAAIGAHAAMTGAFIFMEFAEFEPVAYLESTTSCLFLERPEEIQAYRNTLSALARTALGERQSRQLIATLATELYTDREDHHGRV
ncbi:MAG: helix-turn-helix domain-containing protein [Pseudonocardiales bacterium]